MSGAIKTNLSLAVNRVKSLNFGDMVASSKMQKMEAVELSLLNTYGSYIRKSFARLSCDPQHPINTVAKSIQSEFKETYNKSKSLYSAVDKLDSLLESKIVVYKDAIKNISNISEPDPVKKKEIDLEIETGLRLQLVQSYLNRFKKSLKDKEVDMDSISPSAATRLLHALLLGTSSERFQEHMHIYGAKNPNLSQDDFQACLYALYDPEVETASFSLLAMTALGGEKKMKYTKVIPKISKDFLLDTIDLNTKIRCLMAWSDPDYTGFKPLPDDHTVTILRLIKARQDFFKEGTLIGEKFVDEVVNERRQFYHDKKDNREKIFQGLLFLLGTCLADWAICSM